MNKIVSDAAAAVADIPDGATILVGGFGVLHAWPTTLLEALQAHGTRDLTLICNIGGVGPTSPQVLAENGQIRKIIGTMEQDHHLYGRRSILFVDELHRFNKAQQDAFLPHIEKGYVILIGATTENPSFELNAALLPAAASTLWRG